jgi:hypothetical protein
MRRTTQKPRQHIKGLKKQTRRKIKGNKIIQKDKMTNKRRTRRKAGKSSQINLKQKMNEEVQKMLRDREMENLIDASKFQKLLKLRKKKKGSKFGSLLTLAAYSLSMASSIPADPKTAKMTETMPHGKHCPGKPKNWYYGNLKNSLTGPKQECWKKESKVKIKMKKAQTKRKRRVKTRKKSRVSTK